MTDTRERVGGCSGVGESSARVEVRGQRCATNTWAAMSLDNPHCPKRHDKCMRLRQEQTESTAFRMMRSCIQHVWYLDTGAC